jgi:hypothetical protein
LRLAECHLALMARVMVILLSPVARAAWLSDSAVM